MVELEDYIYRIYVIGAGGTGSNFIPFLSQLLNSTKLRDKGHSFKIIDADRFEAKNMENQKCLERDAGKNKAEALQYRYSNAFKYIEVEYLDEYIKQANRFIELVFEECHATMVMPIIVGCVDNNASRKIINEVFSKIPKCIYIDSGNGDERRKGQIVTGFKRIVDHKQCKDRNGGYNEYCTEPISEVVLPPVAELFPEILDDNDDINKILSCGYNVDNKPQNIATNVTAAVTLFNIINNIISFNYISNNITYFNCENLTMISR